MVIADLIRRKVELKRSMDSMEYIRYDLLANSMVSVVEILNKYQTLCQEREDVTFKLHNLNNTVVYEGKTLAQLKIRANVLKFKMGLLEDYIDALAFPRRDEQSVVDVSILRSKYDTYLEEMNQIKGILRQMSWVDVSEVNNNKVRI